MIFSPHKNFIIAFYLFEPDPELHVHSGTERSSFSDKFRRPGPEPSVLSVNLAGSGPVMFFIDSPLQWTNPGHFSPDSENDKRLLKILNTPLIFAQNINREYINIEPPDDPLLTSKHNLF